jgi:hypothetical protein
MAERGDHVADETLAIRPHGVRFLLGLDHNDPALGVLADGDVLVDVGGKRLGHAVKDLARVLVRLFLRREERTPARAVGVVSRPLTCRGPCESGS